LQRYAANNQVREAVGRNQAANIELSGNYLQSADIKIIAELLKTNTQIKSLNLERKRNKKHVGYYVIGGALSDCDVCNDSMRLQTTKIS
jgi:hypothetical protein